MCEDNKKAKWYVEKENEKTIMLKCRVCGDSKECPNPLDNIESGGN